MVRDGGSTVPSPMIRIDANVYTLVDGKLLVSNDLMEMVSQWLFMLLTLGP